MSDEPADEGGELELPRELPVLPLKSTVVFPRIFIPLSVGRRRSLKLLEDLPGGERGAVGDQQGGLVMAQASDGELPDGSRIGR